MDDSISILEKSVDRQKEDFLKAELRFKEFREGKSCFTEEEIGEYIELRRDKEHAWRSWMDSSQFLGDVRYHKELAEKEKAEWEAKRKASFWGRLFG